MKRYKQANEGIHAPEELKERAARPGARRPYSQWMGAVAAVLAVAVIGGIAMWPGQGGQPMQLAGYNDPAEGAEPSGSPAAGLAQFRATTGGEADGSYHVYALALADVPEMAPYPKDEDFFADVGDSDDAWKKAGDAHSQAYDAWAESRKALRSGTDYTGLMDGFITSTSAQYLAGAGEENRVYSPVNVYMALAMLAETAGGDCREQILDLLEADSIEALRQRANALWRDNYRDDGVVTSLMANSLWLRDGMSYSQPTLDILAEDYYASSFSGAMGSEEYNQALRDWLNAQTNGAAATGVPLAELPAILDLLIQDVREG